jgi:5-methylcytosine-specific restriction endonuclease McrA
MKLPITQADAGLTRARRLLHDHRSRAKRDGAALDYGPPEIRRLIAANTLCAYCRQPLAWDRSLDHKTPIGRGGRHVLDNLAVCCRHCNSLKGQLTEGEFVELLAMLARWHPTARADLERRLLSGGGRYGRARR